MVFNVAEDEETGVLLLGGKAGQMRVERHGSMGAGKVVKIVMWQVEGDDDAQIAEDEETGVLLCGVGGRRSGGGDGLSRREGERFWPTPACTAPAAQCPALPPALCPASHPGRRPATHSAPCSASTPASLLLCSAPCPMPRLTPLTPTRPYPVAVPRTLPHAPPHAPCPTPPCFPVAAPCLTRLPLAPPWPPPPFCCAPGFGEVKKRVRTTAGGSTGSVRNLRIREDTAK